VHKKKYILQIYILSQKNSINCKNLNVNIFIEFIKKSEFKPLFYCINLTVNSHDIGVYKKLLESERSIWEF